MKSFYLFGHNNDDDDDISSYNDTDVASKGVVSFLTNLFRQNGSTTARTMATATSTSKRQKQSNPPTSSLELEQRIKDDYEKYNYLWTGQLDVGCFDVKCRFTDPTLTFEGIDTYEKNVQGIIPLVNRFVIENSYKSKLISIMTTKDYVETRWNMVGSINLPWKPKIDVIGRTKFWYKNNKNDDNNNNNNACVVYFYDEKWEIPAYQALLQIVTPANTFPNSTL